MLSQFDALMGVAAGGRPRTLRPTKQRANLRLQPLGQTSARRVESEQVVP
jgi:hypothetical protein